FEFIGRSEKRAGSEADVFLDGDLVQFPGVDAVRKFDPENEPTLRTREARPFREVFGDRVLVTEDLAFEFSTELPDVAVVTAGFQEFGDHGLSQGRRR